MPRRRRATKRRRSSRRRPAMRPMVREEMKTLDLNPGAATTLDFSTDGTNSQTTALLNAVAQGTSSITRIGKKILMKALQIRGHIYQGTDTGFTKVSLLLVYIRSNNQAASMPSWSEMLTFRGTSGLTNRDNASKYKVLRRWDFALAGVTATPQPSSLFNFEEYVVFKKPLITQFKDATSTPPAIAEYEKGSLHLMAVGNIAQASATRVRMEVSTRLYFCECDGYMF